MKTALTTLEKMELATKFYNMNDRDFTEVMQMIYKIHTSEDNTAELKEHDDIYLNPDIVSAWIRNVMEETIDGYYTPYYEADLYTARLDMTLADFKKIPIHKLINMLFEIPNTPADAITEDNETDARENFKMFERDLTIKEYTDEYGTYIIVHWCILEQFFEYNGDIQKNDDSLLAITIAGCEE